MVEPGIDAGVVDKSERARMAARARKWRQLQTVVGLALLLAASLQVFRMAIATGRPAAPLPVLSANSATATENWSVVISLLDGCRTSALRTRDPQQVDECDVVDSAAWRADRKAIEAMVTQDVQLLELPLQISSVELISRRWSDASEFAELLVTDEMAPYRVTVAGIQQQFPGRSPANWQVTIRRQRPVGDWRFVEVRPAPPASAASP